ncbi:hypothetical protein [Palleronia sp. LCG004]|uniref:hypothetical protein n=1 Tax=Palleronia sp. LCG004 TaxID=3079304 RepID=UPI0029428B56|nr:hypothetical protein [Palleronia sp. LCG004]WOI57687.1 hypothetical protein RVY76_15670 [Palleronia sp. LCG004]
MGRSGDDGQDADHDTTGVDDDPGARSPDWEARLAAARRAREKALAGREKATARPARKAGQETAVSLDRRLEAARTARERALAERKITPPARQYTPPRPRDADRTIGSGRELARTLRHGAPAPAEAEDDATPMRHASLYAAGAAVLVIGTGILAATLKPGSERLPDLSRHDLVIVARSAQTRDLPFAAGDEERRRSTFPIETSSVQYFHPGDVEAAERLATIVGGEPLDLTGLRPSPPEGRLIVYLADEGS